MQLETEILQLRQDLDRERHQANVDPLTGIPNRRAYQSRLQEELARCARENKSLCLIVWDIDHFKSINDRYGHEIGDGVLSCIARKISLRLRRTDFVARLGGEEFVALLPNCDIENARLLAEQLRQEIAQCHIESTQGLVNVTVSCGIAEYNPDDSESSLFARADAALYRAKGDGRNRVCIAADGVA
jgi:diguanylate cyclase